jgi:hypothetical protein
MRQPRTNRPGRRGMAALGVLTLLTASTACGSDGPSNAGASPAAFAAVPDFVALKDVAVEVDGRTMPLGETALRYLRRTAEAFDDPMTPGHEGIGNMTRQYLACEADQWNIAGQIFTVDLVIRGVDTGDESMVAAGVKGLDWGIGVPVNDAGVHVLHRSCDDRTTDDYGETHHTTQWVAALGTAVYVLENSPYAERWRTNIDRYVARIEELATLLADEDNTEHWAENWLVDDHGNLFTHKTFMRAAALSLAASLTDSDENAAGWAHAASEIAQRGIDEQRENGVNPERGGYDVSYQMYGTWLAILYWSMLGPDDPMKPRIEATIDRAIDWMSTRVDDQTGQVDIGQSTRTCNASSGSQGYDAADAVRVYLLWGHLQGRDDLVDTAVRIDAAARGVGNRCPS